MHKKQLMDASIYSRALLNAATDGHSTEEDIKALASKITFKMGEFDMDKIDIATMRAIGSSPWSEEDGKSLFLLPGYFANNAAPFMAVDINEQEEWYESSTADKDTRYGMLAVGKLFASNYPLNVLTSSKQKTVEYSNLGIQAIAPKVDTPEVQGTPDEVILYKALQADEFVFVEDTVVVIDGKPIVDWKFTYKDHVVPGKPFVWEVRLAYRKNGYIYSCTEKMNLVFTDDEPTSPDFDAYSKMEYTTPDGYPTYKKSTDDELLVNWKETSDDYTSEGPRGQAVRRHRYELFDLVVPESIVKPWTGDMQS